LQSSFFGHLNRDVRNIIYEYLIPQIWYAFQPDPDVLGFLFSCRLARSEFDEALHHDFKKRLPQWRTAVRKYIIYYDLSVQDSLEVDLTVSISEKRLKIHLSDSFVGFVALLPVVAYYPFETL
jgi:hypothetical protein